MSRVERARIYSFALICSKILELAAADLFHEENLNFNHPNAGDSLEKVQ